MGELAFADRVEVLVLVDNVTDNLSTVPEFVENEFRRFWRRGGSNPVRPMSVLRCARPILCHHRAAGRRRQDAVV